MKSNNLYHGKAHQKYLGPWFGHTLAQAKNSSLSPTREYLKQQQHWQNFKKRLMMIEWVDLHKLRQSGEIRKSSSWVWLLSILQLLKWKLFGEIIILLTLWHRIRHHILWRGGNTFYLSIFHDLWPNHKNILHSQTMAKSNTTFHQIFYCGMPGKEIEWALCKCKN